MGFTEQNTLLYVCKEKKKLILAVTKVVTFMCSKIYFSIVLKQMLSTSSGC